MAHEQEIIVSKKPTADMALGLYRVVRGGLYWGTFRVTMNWCGDRFVMEWYY